MICATGFLRGFRHDPLLARLVDEQGLETVEGWIVLEPDGSVPALTDELADARARGRAGAVGVPGRGHARRCALRRPRVPAEDQGMSYTLRGRVESRLAAFVPLVAAACVLALALHRWWPVEAVALMVGVGVCSTCRSTTGCSPTSRAGRPCRSARVELGSSLGLMRLLGIAAPFWQAVALFAGGWLLAQLLGHAGFPLLRLEYAEDGRRARPARRRLGARRRESSLAGAAGDRLRAGAARSSI